MSITIATLKAAGLTAEQIVAVFEEMEADRAAAAEAKRIKNRDRMRASRAARALHSVHNANSVHNDAQTEIVQQKQHPVHDVQRTERTDEPESALSFLLPSESQKGKEEKKEKKERAKRDRGTVCPDDLVPSEAHFEAGERQGVSRMRVQACCAAMKDWSKSNANRAIARKVDWSAALFGWISRESERKKVNGATNPTMAAFDRFDARNALHEGQGDFGGLDFGGPIIEGR